MGIVHLFKEKKTKNLSSMFPSVLVGNWAWAGIFLGWVKDFLVSLLVS